MEEIWQALQSLRVPLQRGEYDLHALVEARLEEAGIASEHEAVLGPRCRIDLLCGRIGIEIKRGKPDRRKLLEQLGRYAAHEQIDAIVVICERSVDLPATIHGKPLRLLCLNRLWGIAL